MDMALLLGLLFVLALLAITGWLLWQVLRQQGRLLMRIEATEACLALPGHASVGDQGGGSVTGQAEVTAPHNDAIAGTPLPGPVVSLGIGELAPDFSLPGLTGTLVHLSDFRGTPTLVFFWQPSSNSCQLLLPRLLAWETQPSRGATRLLVVSTGSVQDNVVLGLRSPVLLDQADRSIGKMFGAPGTPTAVLIDAEGRIASELAAGIPAILALARTQFTQAEEGIELTIGMATYHDFDGWSNNAHLLPLQEFSDRTEPARRKEDMSIRKDKNISPCEGSTKISRPGNAKWFLRFEKPNAALGSVLLNEIGALVSRTIIHDNDLIIARACLMETLNGLE